MLICSSENDDFEKQRNVFHICYLCICKLQICNTCFPIRCKRQTTPKVFKYGQQISAAHSKRLYKSSTLVIQQINTFAQLKRLNIQTLNIHSMQDNGSNVSIMHIAIQACLNAYECEYQIEIGRSIKYKSCKYHHH